MGYPRTRDEFNQLVETIKKSPAYREPLFYAIGLKTGRRTEYPVVNDPGQNTGTAAILLHVLEVAKTHGLRDGEATVKIGRSEISEILPHFWPFEMDGQKHDNIRVLERAWHHLPGEVVATFVFGPIPEGDSRDERVAALRRRYFDDAVRV